MSDMRKLLESVNKFAGEPEQKPGDQVRGTDKATSKGDRHPFLKRLVGEAEKVRHVTEMRADYERFLKEFAAAVNEENPQDVIKMDVPLLLRVMEYAKEDAKTDMDLHHVADKLIELSSSGRVLNMNDYDSLVKDTVSEQLPTSPTAATLQPASTGAATMGGAAADPQALAKMKAQQLKSVADQKKQIQDQIKQTTDQLTALRKQLAQVSNPANISMMEQGDKK